MPDTDIPSALGFHWSPIALCVTRRRDGGLVWCRVAGQATDTAAPAREAVWAFEPLPAAAAPAASLSPRTVEMHRARLLRKAGVRTTAQLLALL